MFQAQASSEMTRWAPHQRLILCASSFESGDFSTSPHSISDGTGILLRSGVGVYFRASVVHLRRLQWMFAYYISLHVLVPSMTFTHILGILLLMVH